LISQPIKGTIQRKKNKEEDQKVIEWLTHSQKDKSENTMIVDLVRNDMSKIAQKNSVVVPELCAIYTFPTLHHMISTVQCEIKSNTHVIEIFKALFPMGSMTGVPKKISVQKMNEMEKKPRGWYSGTCGWMSPDGNFDFNVIIRSIVYNQSTGESKIGIGSAITLASDFKSEWAECKLKARSLTSPQLANEN
jgi:para-aminobenzoate synthetase component 1